MIAVVLLLACQIPFKYGFRPYVSKSLFTASGFVIGAMISCTLYMISILVAGLQPCIVGHYASSIVVFILTNALSMDFITKNDLDGKQSNFDNCFYAGSFNIFLALILLLFKCCITVYLLRS